MNFSWRQRLNVSRLAIKHPWLTISFWLGVAVAGLFAFFSLEYALFPDVTFPVVIIRAESNLDNAFDTSEKITTPLESALLTLESVEMISSSSYPNQAVITNLFFAGDSLKERTNLVKKTIANVKLPANTKIEIIPYNLNESSAITYAVTSETQTLTEITTITQSQIIPQLEKIDGILKINLLGIDNNPQTQTEESQPTSTIVHYNGQEGLAIQIIKQGEANTLKVVDLITTTMAKIEPQLTDINIQIAQNQADYIQEATGATIDSLVLAVILAILVIYPFLGNFNATLITTLTIPLSLLATFIVMAIYDFNLETITLLALALVIGIVVDDAIVDVENIARHIEQGYTPKQAAIKGSDEIGLSVSASTITIVAVFLPVAFTSGNVGQFFKPFALTISAAVMASLLIARTLVPVLCMYWLKRKSTTKSQSESNKWGQLINEVYTNWLKWSLSHRRLVLLAGVVSFVIGIGLIPFIPQGFIPQLDRGEFNIIYTTELPKLANNEELANILTQKEENRQNNENEGVFSWLSEVKSNPSGFILRRTSRVGEEIEEAILEIPEIASSFNTVGFRGQPNQGKIYLRLKDDRQFTTSEVQNLVREKLPQLKNTQVSVEDIKFVDTGDEKPFALTLLSDNLTALFKTASTINQELSQVTSLVDLSFSPADIDIQNNDNIPLIEHRHGKPSVTFTANLASGNALGDVTTEVVDIIQPLLAEDVVLSVGGDSARMMEVLKQFSITFAFSIVMMLLVLWGLFGSLLEPLVVAFSLPLSIVGAMLALLISQSDFGMISLLGLIFLVGLLDKNALLLIDYTNQLRKQGKTRYDAIVLSCQTRFRPILMTTLSTILGMLPIAIGFGAGAQLRQPMAVAIVGGLITSSVLSLIFVPVFYTVVEDIWRIEN